MKIASQTLDTMSLHLPPDQVVPPIFENAQRYIQSTEASHRKACMIAIAVVMEGASDYIKPHLKSVIPLVFIKKEEKKKSYIHRYSRYV